MAVLLQSCIDDIASRLSGVEKAMRSGTLTEKDGRYLREGWAYVLKDGPAPLLGVGRSGATQQNPSNPNAAVYDEDTGGVPFITTVLQVDRDGDIVYPPGYQGENYAKSPVWFFGHQERPWAIAIGTSRNPKTGAIDVFPGDRQIRQIWYPDKPDSDAMLIHGKVLRRVMSSVSMAFVPIKAHRRDREREKGLYDKAKPHHSPDAPPGWFFEAWDHTETSVCGVGSNPGALSELRDTYDREKSFMSPRLRKAWPFVTNMAKSINEAGGCFVAFDGVTYCPVKKDCGCDDCKAGKECPCGKDEKQAGVMTGGGTDIDKPGQVQPYREEKAVGPFFSQWSGKPYFLNQTAAGFAITMDGEELGAGKVFATESDALGWFRNNGFTLRPQQPDSDRTPMGGRKSFEDAIRAVSAVLGSEPFDRINERTVRWRFRGKGPKAQQAVEAAAKNGATGVPNSIDGFTIYAKGLTAKPASAVQPGDAVWAHGAWKRVEKVLQSGGVRHIVLDDQTSIRRAAGARVVAKDEPWNTYGPDWEQERYGGGQHGHRGKKPKLHGSAEQPKDPVEDYAPFRVQQDDDGGHLVVDAANRIVGAFDSEQQANQRVAKLDKWADEWNKAHPDTRMDPKDYKPEHAGGGNRGGTCQRGERADETGCTPARKSAPPLAASPNVQADLERGMSSEVIDRTKKPCECGACKTLRKCPCGKTCKCNKAKALNSTSGPAGGYTMATDKTLPSEEADVSPEKARTILHDGHVNGKPLTEAQRGLFGAIASRGKSMSKFIVKTPRGYTTKDKDKYADDKDDAKKHDGADEALDEAVQEGGEVEEVPDKEGEGGGEGGGDEEPFVVKPSMKHAAMLYQNAKDEDEFNTAGLATMDHEGMTDGLKKYHKKFITPRMEHLKGLVHEHHGKNTKTKTPDELMEKIMKGMETDGAGAAGGSPGEAQMVDEGHTSPDDPDTEEILQREEDPGTKKMFTRRVGYVRRGLDGKLYVTKQLPHTPPFETGRDDPKPVPQPHTPPFGKKLSDEDVSCVEEAADYLDGQADDEAVPKQYRVNSKSYARRLGQVHKALSNMGKVQHDGGRGSELSDKGKVERDGGGGSALSDKGEVQTSHGTPGREIIQGGGGGPQGGTGPTDYNKKSWQPWERDLVEKAERLEAESNGMKRVAEQIGMTR